MVRDDISPPPTIKEKIMDKNSKPSKPKSVKTGNDKTAAPETGKPAAPKAMPHK